MMTVAYAAILFLTNVLGSLAGFGAGLLSLPFLTQMFDAKMIIIATSITCLLNIYIAVIWRQYIHWKHLGIMVLYMCIGLPFGIAFLKFMPVPVIKFMLGLLMIGVGIYGLAKLHWEQAASVRFGKLLLRIFLLAGGIAQGVVSGGGSFVILYAQQEISDKHTFRATLAMMWTTVNIVGIVQYGVAGMLSAECFHYALIGAPAVFAGICLGGMLSRKVSQRTFLYVVNILLIGAGIISCVGQAAA